MSTPPAALRARVLAATSEKKSLTRPQAQRRALVLLVLSILVAASVLALAGGIAGPEARPRLITAALVGGWALASVVLAYLVLGRGSSTLGHRPALLLPATLAAPIVLFLWMHLFHGTYAEPYARFGVRCFTFTLVMAATPLAAFFVLRRGTEPRAPGVLGGAAGAACGALAGVLVDLWCPLTDASHVLAGHVAPLSILAVVGAILGSRLLGARRL